MSRSDAALARRITWRESKQSYFTMRLLVDRDLVDDSYRAYAYFRWADDVVDELLKSKEARLAFIRGQRALIEGLYAGRRPDHLKEEEVLIADLIQHDRGPQSGLRSYIENFLAIIEFDAERRGRRISEAELRGYTDRLALAVTDAILYFIRNGHPYPEDARRIAGARAAHITHMLRDLRKDLDAGYANIPTEYLEGHGIRPEDIDSPAFRDWVKARVDQARQEFQAGKEYIDELDVLRTKIAARWYCSRFEHVLDTIEADGYLLRMDYAAKHRALGYLKMAGVAVRVIFQHARSVVGRRTRHPVDSAEPC
jgi:phytoene/squalene synthetase